MKMMNTRPWILICIFTAGALFAGVASLADEEQEVAPTLEQILDSAKIPLSEAVSLALHAHPGRAVEAEFESELQDGKTVLAYEVKVLDSSGLFYELRLDPSDGRILGEEIDDEEEEEEEDEAERRNLTRAADASKMTLAACIDSAAAENKGEVFAAGFEIDDGEPICEALTAGSKRYYEIEISLLDGDILEVEATRSLEAEDDDDDDDDGDERNEED